MYDARHRTGLYMLKSGEVLPSDEAILLCFPGMGGMHSSACSLLYLMTELAYESGPRRIAAIGFDQPRHGAILDQHDPAFLSMRHYMKWTDAIIETYLGYEKPIITFGRSVGGSQMLQYNATYGQKVRGSIAMSAFHPAWLEYDLAQMRKKTASRTFKLNRPALELIKAHSSEWSWHEKPGNVPTLIIHGLSDGSYPQAEAYRFWPAFVHEHSFRLGFITGGGHDCFPEEQPAVTNQSLAASGQFIRDVLKRLV